MLHLKNILDQCDPLARTSAHSALVALSAINPNMQNQIAERLYLACRKDPADVLYFKKQGKEMRYESDDPADWDQEEELAHFNAARDLGINQAAFSESVTEKLCDAMEALSGHSPKRQAEIAAKLSNIIVTVVTDIEQATAASRTAPEKDEMSSGD